MNKRDLIVCMLGFCIAALLFTAIPAIGQTAEYDPWLDINDDGYIGIDDIYTVASSFGAEGEPINKTQLLLELLSRLDELNNTVIEQQITINNLNQSVVYLNEILTTLNSTGLGAPDYDSGVISIVISQHNYVVHNLNTMRLMVYVLGVTADDGRPHQIHYGGAVTNELWEKRGAWWTCIDNNTIDIFPMGNEYLWTHCRVMVWKIP